MGCTYVKEFTFGKSTGSKPSSTDKPKYARGGMVAPARDMVAPPRNTPAPPGRRLSVNPTDMGPQGAPVTPGLRMFSKGGSTSKAKCKC